MLSCPIDECGIWQGIVRNAFCCILIRNSLHLAAWGAIFCLALAAPLVVRLAESLKELQEERTRKFKIPHFFSATGRSLNHPFKKGFFFRLCHQFLPRKSLGWCILAGFLLEEAVLCLDEGMWFKNSIFIDHATAELFIVRWGENLSAFGEEN